MDCSKKFGNNGCYGGLPEFAFNYVIQYGIETEAEYPYLAQDTPCTYSADLARKVINGSTIVPSGNCDELTKSLMKQPISVGIDANNWKNYNGGIFSACGVDDINHAVLLVGQTADYWLVKNSWGTTWGENGYIRMALGDTCGICDVASTGNLGFQMSEEALM